MDVRNAARISKKQSVCLMAVFSFALATSSPIWAGAANYTYDTLGRITQVVYADGSTTTTITYQYDATGNRTAVVTTRSP